MLAGPPGYELQPDTAGNTGPADLAKAQRQTDTPEDAKQLQTDGFVVGYQEVFTKGDQDQVIVFVYQFATPEGANHTCATASSSVVAKANSQGITVTSTSVAVPGAVAAKGEGVGRSITAVDFSRGVYCGRIVVTGPSASPPPDDLAGTLAVQQYEQLA